jgi:hypothetical protein
LQRFVNFCRATTRCPPPSSVDFFLVCTCRLQQCALADHGGAAAFAAELAKEAKAKVKATKAKAARAAAKAKAQEA